jgi:hypothetical protein
VTAIELLYDMETELLANLVRALARGDVGSAAWSAKKLGDLGIVSAKNAQAVRRALKKALPLIQAEVREHGIKAVSTFDRYLDGLQLSEVLPFDASKAVVDTLATWEGKATTAIEKMGSTLLVGTNALYIDAIEKASTQVLIGAKSGREAIAEVARTWADKGVTALVDAAGRQWSVEAYAATVIRSNVRNVVTETQKARCADFGVDLVEVSSHVGARPGCAPYQGRIYSLSGASAEYPPLSSTSYGEPAGLFGINCGHQMYPYVPGASTRTFEPVPEKENEKAYETSQEQRALERAIRKSRREVAMMEALGDERRIQSAKEKLARRRDGMKQFIEESGRTRRLDRERIY